MTEAWFEEWVRKAEEDYLVASSLDANTTPSAVCFHCQQCVEKYLKAALAKQGGPIRKIRNLTVLNDLVAEQDARFEKLHDELGSLNPYSVVGRYPGSEPSIDEARRALDMASSLRRQMRDLLGLRAEG